MSTFQEEAFLFGAGLGSRTLTVRSSKMASTDNCNSLGVMSLEKTNPATILSSLLANGLAHGISDASPERDVFPSNLTVLASFLASSDGVGLDSDEVGIWDAGLCRFRGGLFGESFLSEEMVASSSVG